MKSELTLKEVKSRRWHWLAQSRHFKRTGDTELFTEARHHYEFYRDEVKKRR